MPFLHKEEKEARGAIVIDGSMTPMRAAHSEKEGALLFFFILWDKMDHQIVLKAAIADFMATSGTIKTMCECNINKLSPYCHDLCQKHQERGNSQFIRQP